MEKFARDCRPTMFDEGYASCWLSDVKANRPAQALPDSHSTSRSAIFTGRLANCAKQNFITPKNV